MHPTLNSETAARTLNQGFGCAAVVLEAAKEIHCVVQVAWRFDMRTSSYYVQCCVEQGHPMCMHVAHRIRFQLHSKHDRPLQTSSQLTQNLPGLSNEASLYYSQVSYV